MVQTSAVLERGAGFLTLHHNPWKSTGRQQQDSNGIPTGFQLDLKREIPHVLCAVTTGTEPNAVGMGFCGRGGYYESL